MAVTDTARPLLPAHPPKNKPDPRPMQLALGAGGIAALSALSAAVVMPPRYSTPAVQPADATQSTAGLLTDSGQGSPSILYVQLAPGETAPPGAMVVDSSAAPAASGGGAGSATSIATRLPGGGTTTAPVVAPKPTPKPTPAPIKTTQSGKVVK
jgi:hypothetical protein